MKNIFEPQTAAQTIHRINSLKPDNQRQWGKMNVSQMMAHCSAVLEHALGDKVSKPSFFARLLGPLFKGMMASTKPFSKNAPTGPDFVIVDERDFDAERQKLLRLLERFVVGGEMAVEGKRHPFFGKLSSAQWSNGIYKHLDHHLRQFGV